MIESDRSTGRHAECVLDLQPAVPGDAAELCAVREAAARWLVGRGIRQWLPGEVDLRTVLVQIAAGEWFLHRRDGRVLVALRFLWTDAAVWGEHPDDHPDGAAYVHGLMIDRRRAGEGRGAAALRWAEERTTAAGRTFLRLDHAADNARLARYYRERGFIERGRRNFVDWGPVTLVEKALTRRTPEAEGLRGSA